jgi:hypothetical protein
MTEEEKLISECKTCKSDGLQLKHWGVIALGVYILGSAIYGTVQIVKHIVHQF